MKFGQSIREEGPASHQAKSGTPTMGGMMIILGITVATLVAAPLTTEILLALFIMLGHFVLGFLDDYIKVVKKRNLGLKAKQKLLGQIIIAVVTMFIGTRMLGIDTTIWVPVLEPYRYWRWLLCSRAVCYGGHYQCGEPDGWPGWPGFRYGGHCLQLLCVVCSLMGIGDLAIFCVAIGGGLSGLFAVQRPSGQGIYG